MVRTSSRHALLLASVVAIFSACAHPGVDTMERRDHAGAPRVITADVDTFWAAYDSARSTTDSLTQLRIIQTRYIDRGTPGVAAFMAAKGYTAESWVGAIRRYPKFWASIRPNTYLAKESAATLEPYIARLRALYPPLRPATLYVTVGALASAGTTVDSTVLIGAEFTGTPETDISEFEPRMHTLLARYFETRPLTNIVLLNVHEYVHTQQHGIGATVLARAIREGSADWIAEIVTGSRPPLAYMTYGPAHEAELRETFKAEMFTPLIRNWFYNSASSDPRHVADLGYYMGYAIARSFYNRAADKQQAIRQLIELPFDDDGAVEAFLQRSGYYASSEVADKPALLRAYAAHRPFVVRVVPSDSLRGIDAGTKEIRIEFSAPMASSYMGFDFGPGGKAAWPVTGRIGFSADARSYTVQVGLEPGRRYSMVLEGSEGGGFRSLDGYPLRPDTVMFATRAAP